jgi:hypothetical protein
MKKALLVACFFAVVAGHASAAATASCPAGALSATFKAIPNSQGAGNIVYRLRVTNHSARSCTLTGIPPLTLLGAQGKPLPTHIAAGRPGALNAVRITLPPHTSISATARFSPDVPGVGEQEQGPCEPTSAKLRIAAPGGGKLVAAVVPATPVCEHGTLSFTAFAR